MDLKGFLQEVRGHGGAAGSGPALAVAGMGEGREEVREPDGPPKGASVRARRLWYVEEQIKLLRKSLAQAEAEQNLTRQSSLSGQLLKWLEELGNLSPAEPDAPEDEEARWKEAAASAIAKIERGVRQAEGSAACRRCGAACAACNGTRQGVASGA